jgi:coenzyme F420-reducing hydrogenase delta subunit
MRLECSPNVRIIKVPCSGRVESLHLIKCFEEGIDGVFVAGCLEGECHFMVGNLQAKRRVQYVKKVLQSIGINPLRLEMYNLSAAMGSRFAEITWEMTNRIKELGPNPVKTGKGKEV